jgi:hypothetical protein
MPTTHEPPKEFFERCPRCLRTWDLFPIFRCPSCQIVFCGCCDEDDRPDDESRWLVAARAELRTFTCPACTMQVTVSNRLGSIRRKMAKTSPGKNSRK